MPSKPRSNLTENTSNPREYSAGTTAQPTPAMLAAASPQVPFPSTSTLDNPGSTTLRPKLPPLSQIQTQPGSPFSPSSYSASYTQHVATAPQSAYGHPSNLPSISYLNTSSHGPAAPNLRPAGQAQYPLSPTADYEYPHGPSSRPYNPLKRPHELSEAATERSGPDLPLPYTPITAEMNDPRAFHSSGSMSSTSTPTTASYPTLGNQPAFSPLPSIQSYPNLSRCKLHIRQQPRAARAGPDGKDRRPIDPPPILQLLMTDFDPDSPSDLDDMSSQFWVVHCRLVSANSPRRDVSTLASVSEDGSQEVQRLLLGTSVASPHYTKDDPDPKTAPNHPTTTEERSGPPSPSSRFFASASDSSRAPRRPQRPLSQMPGTFFIFADLSIRKAGEYRLEFSLMRMIPEFLQRGSTLPILHTVASKVFKVVNAKDFDQVKPSTALVKGLLERGAGFPLKLKKGTREVGRRKVLGEFGYGAMGGEQGDDEDEEEEDEAGDDDTGGPS